MAFAQQNPTPNRTAPKRRQRTWDPRTRRWTWIWR